MLKWIDDNQAVVWSLGGLSLVMFFASIFIVPAIIARIPSDYFAHERRPAPRWAQRHPAIRIALHLFKNLLGVVFLFAGLAMLVLPGQGLLTLALGMCLLDLPGKYRFERWLIARRAIGRPVNWLRRRAGRPPLKVYEPLAASSDSVADRIPLTRTGG